MIDISHLERQGENEMSHSDQSLNYNADEVDRKSQTSSTAATAASDRAENVRPGAKLPTFDEDTQQNKRQVAVNDFQADEDEKRTNIGNAVGVKDAVEAGSLTQDHAGPQTPISDARRQELDNMRRDGFSP